MNNSKKLNLGCGKDYKKGWLNVDVSTEYKVDVIADLNKKFPFNDNFAEEILISDILEHFTREDGETFLKECYRVLQFNGKITIRTHNIFQIFDQFQFDPQVMIHFIYGNTKEDGIFGSHKYAYTEKALKRLLILIGFELISFERETTNFLVIAKKKKQKASNLHIGIIMQSPDLGGAETYMLTLIDQFLDKKNKVFVASNKEKFLDKAKEFSVKTYEIPMILDIIGNYRGLIKSISLLPQALYFYSSLLRKFEKEKVDVILMSNFSEKLFVTFLSNFYRIPVVWIEYGRLKTVLKRNFYLPKIVYRILKNIPYAIIVPSKNTMQSLITDARVSLAKIAIIPLGIPQPKIKTRGKEKLFDIKNAFTIGSVSRLTKEKGQDYLIKAMPGILQKVPNARLLIIGDGPDKIYYENLVTELRLQGKIKILGFVKGLDSYYQFMDIFIFPTVWDLEGFGLVLTEAMSHRLPIIANNIGPVPEIVDDGKTGILVKPHDEKILAQAIISLATNPSKRKMLGENGYKKFTQKYIIDKSATDILAILHEASIKI